MSFWNPTRLRSKASSGSTKDWLLVLLYVGWGGPVLVIASWLVWSGEIRLTPLVGFNLAVLVVVVAGGLMLLGERLGFLDTTRAENGDSPE